MNYWIIAAIVVFLSFFLAAVLSCLLFKEKQPRFLNFLCGLFSSMFDKKRRMLAVLRYRRTARSHFTSLQGHAFHEFMHKLHEQIRQLRKAWAKYAHFEEGFYGSEYGLPGPGEENWRIFAIYRVSSFTKVKKCMSIYESERFLFLRQHCELYLLYGKELEHLEEGAHELV